MKETATVSTMQDQSRYAQLCRAYAKNLTDFKQYKETCYRFLNQLMIKLQDAYDIPPERLCLRSKQDPKQLTDNLMEAMDMQKDTFWHVRISITVFADAEGDVKERMSFEIMVKKLPTYFVLAIPNEQEFNIDDNPQHDWDFSLFFDYVFNSLKNFYEHELERFLNTGATGKKEISPIGFRFIIDDDEDDMEDGEL
jgi:hypothetical protein